SRGWWTGRASSRAIGASSTRFSARRPSICFWTSSRTGTRTVPKRREERPMNYGRELEGDLLGEIRRRIDRVYAEELRLGSSADVGLAEVGEKSPTPLDDHADVLVTPAAVPVQSPGRLASLREG